jgi:hypothetical protein
MEATAKQLLVSLDNARHVLGDIGRTKLYDLVEQRKIVQVSVGRRSFITAESLERYVDSLTQPAEADGQLGLFDEPPRQERKLVPLGKAGTRD